MARVTPPWPSTRLRALASSPMPENPVREADNVDARQGAVVGRRGRPEPWQVEQIASTPDPGEEPLAVLRPGKIERVPRLLRAQEGEIFAAAERGALAAFEVGVHLGEEALLARRHEDAELHLLQPVEVIPGVEGVGIAAELLPDIAAPHQHIGGKTGGKGWHGAGKKGDIVRRHRDVMIGAPSLQREPEQKFGCILIGPERHCHDPRYAAGRSRSAPCRLSESRSPSPSPAAHQAAFDRVTIAAPLRMTPANVSKCSLTSDM